MVLVLVAGHEGGRPRLLRHAESGYRRGLSPGSDHQPSTDSPPGRLPNARRRVGLTACDPPAEEREVLLDFVEESYRAVATKTLIKHLDADIVGTGNKGHA